MGLSQVPSESMLGTFSVVSMLGLFSSEFLFITHFDFQILTAFVTIFILVNKDGA